MRLLIQNWHGAYCIAKTYDSPFQATTSDFKKTYSTTFYVKGCFCFGDAILFRCKHVTNIYDAITTRPHLRIHVDARIIISIYRSMYLAIILLFSVLFCSVLFHFVCSALFCSALFYSNSILLDSILFYSMLFYSALHYSILFCSTLFYSTVSYSIYLPVYQ